MVHEARRQPPRRPAHPAGDQHLGKQGPRGHRPPPRPPPPGVAARPACDRLTADADGSMENGPTANGPTAKAEGKPGRSARAGQIVATARVLLEREGPGALTMRRLGEELGIRARSLYKHLAGKKAIGGARIEEGFRAIGAALHAAIKGRAQPVDATRNLL